VDDGVRSARLVEGNGVRLAWAPGGPGRPARWRLPPIEEAVSSITRHSRSAHGDWNATTGIATYTVQPDKESPLWNTRSKVIYWWTGSATDSAHAHMIACDDNVWERNARRPPAYFAFRRVREP
jgi:hypothetical protein